MPAAGQFIGGGNARAFMLKTIIVEGTLMSDRNALERDAVAARSSSNRQRIFPACRLLLLVALSALAAQACTSNPQSAAPSAEPQVAASQAGPSPDQ